MAGHVCPVCGKHEFEYENDFSRCPECWWVNDAFQEEYPDIGGGANVESLNEFRDKMGFPPVEKNRGVTMKDLREARKKKEEQ